MAIKRDRRNGGNTYDIQQMKQVTPCDLFLDYRFYKCIYRYGGSMWLLLKTIAKLFFKFVCNAWMETKQNIKYLHY